MTRRCPDSGAARVGARRQRGLTLLELLLALTVGAVLSAAVIQLYLSNQTAFRAASGVARLQENARFVAGYLRDALQQAGRPAFSGLYPVAVDALADDDDAAGPHAGDIIAVRFRGAPDCLGNVAPPSTLVEQRFLLRRDADGVGRLYCMSSLYTDAAGAPLAVAVADGIDQLQALYGVDADAPADGVANRYVAAAALRAAALVDPGVAGRVVSLRVALLLNSVEPVRADTQTVDYALLDRTGLRYRDRLGRRVMTLTIPLRNRGGA